MGSPNLRRGSSPSSTAIPPWQGYASLPRYISNCPSQQPLTSPPPFPPPQVNRQFPLFQHHLNRAPPQHSTRAPPRRLKPFPQGAPQEVHRNHHRPLPQNLRLPPPARHFTSSPQQSAPPPNVRRNHQSHPQLPNRQSKRPKRESDRLGEPNHGHKQDDSKDCKKPATWSKSEAQNYLYNPDRDEDPFKHSRSLRHQQPANPRRRRHDDSDSDKKSNDEQEYEGDSDFGEEHAEKEERVYKELLPKVQQLVSQLGGVNEKWTHDKEEKMCLVCNVPTRLKGWKALLQHSENFQKRKRIQHRAYFRILSEILQPEGFTSAGEGKSVLIDNGKATEEVIVWPPVVILDNLGEESEYVDACLTIVEPSDVQKTFPLSKRGHPGVGRTVVVFPSTEVGHLNSKMLVDSLSKVVTPEFLYDRLTPRPAQAQLCQQAFSCGSNRRVKMMSDSHSLSNVNTSFCDRRRRWRHKSIDEPPQEHRRAFLAKPSDMQHMDPARKLVNWSIENKWEILKRILKESKEEHELEKAKVKAKLVEVDHIAESHQQFKSRKALLSQRLKDAEKALKLQKEKEDQIAKQHADQLQVMDKKFKEEVRKLEFERISREARIRRLLEANEKQLENERVERGKEVDFLLRHLETVNQELRSHTARKALEKEYEIARKREEIYNEIKVREANFNEEGRNLEKNLLEKQESEKMKFVEEYNTIRQEFLDEWVAKQAALKEKAAKAKQEKELLLKMAETKKKEAEESHPGVAECSICFEEFDDNNNRALIQPCGHAKTCLPCAINIFGQSKLCPICREKMSSKPKAIPFKLFM